MRYFTLEEAREAIPRLEKIFLSAADISARAQAKAVALRSLNRDLDPARFALEKAQLDFLASSADEVLREIEAMGAVVKGLNPGLVDFPARLDGREVYLCWRQGEEEVGHFHGIEEGFAGRKPLPQNRSSLS